jgi:hypothetical protein
MGESLGSPSPEWALAVIASDVGEARALETALKAKGLPAQVRVPQGELGAIRYPEVWVRREDLTAAKALMPLVQDRMGKIAVMRGFTVASMEEAEAYVAVLGLGDVLAVVKPPRDTAGTTEAPKVEVWVQQKDLARAKDLVFDFLAERMPAEPIRTSLRYHRIRFYGWILWTVYTVLLIRISISSRAWPEWPFVVIALAGGLFLLLFSGLRFFRQFQWSDLFLLTCYLPAVIGLTLRGYEPDTPPTVVLLSLGVFVVLTLMVWAGIVGLMNRSRVGSMEERVSNILAAFLGLTLVWLFTLWLLAN